jgi:NAD(P)-dependent dehydrogenase (short-subunit alcohol dehydrogenase family)
MQTLRISNNVLFIRKYFQITGTGHGIGKELAMLYASKGATVVAWDMNEKNNKNTVQDITKMGYKAYAYTYAIFLNVFHFHDDLLAVWM